MAGTSPGALTGAEGDGAALGASTIFVRPARQVSAPTTTLPSVGLSATAAHIPPMATQARHSHSVLPRHDASIRPGECWGGDWRGRNLLSDQATTDAAGDGAADHRYLHVK